MNWKTTQDIESLIESLNNNDEIDMTSLPNTKLIANDFIDTSYPIWTINDLGWCLVGTEARSIEHLIDIIDPSVFFSIVVDREMLDAGIDVLLKSNHYQFWLVHERNGEDFDGFYFEGVLYEFTGCSCKFVSREDSQ